MDSMLTDNNVFPSDGVIFPDKFFFVSASSLLKGKSLETAIGYKWYGWLGINKVRTSDSAYNFSSFKLKIAVQ